METRIYREPDGGRAVTAQRACLGSMGLQEAMPAGRLQYPAGLPVWLFMFFHSEAELRIEDEWCPVPPNTLFIWPPGMAQGYGRASGRWLHSWLQIGGREVPRLLGEAGVPEARVVRLGQPAMTVEYFRRFFHERSVSPEASGAILRAQFASWLHEAGRLLRRGGKPSVHPGAAKLKLYLDAHLDRSLSLADMAAEAGLSIPHLSDRFKRAYGSSPVNYHTQRRMEYAAFLLEERGLRVGEAAARVGCADIYHFSRLFKRKMGLAPSRWAARPR